MDRNTLRKQRLMARDQLEPSVRREKSRRICQLLTGHPLINSAGHLFIYVHFRSEVETAELIRHLIAAGKTISVPVTRLDESRLLAVQVKDIDRQLVKGCYGILEPGPELIARATVSPETIDAALIPGSVFDLNGGRLGYGGGYYDRFLSRDAAGASRIGLAFETQLVERVPMQPHDQYMDELVTEKQIYDCRRIRNAQDSCV